MPPREKRRGTALLAGLSLLLAAMPAAAQLQSDCRGVGKIGNAYMSGDGTVTLTVTGRDGTQRAFAYHKNDPNYARILSHIGGMQPGEHKAVPAFCN